jgi:acyl CoA:acetate/3-ketoacid CoA transferase beta subunit
MTGHPDPADQLTFTLARQAQPGDVAVVGVATPIAAAAALLARELVRDMTVIVAASVDPPAHDISRPMLRADAVARIATGTFSQSQVLDAIQRGRISLQYVSPAQVDGNGRLNTSRVPGRDGALRRLPGGLATGDIAVLVGRLVAYRADHSPRFLPDEVAFTTGAGHERGSAWRDAHGLPGSGVQTIVTSRAVLVWDPRHGGFQLESIHGGASIEDAVAGCGFPLLVPDHVPVTEPPDDRALRLLDDTIDPHGMRRLETPDGRSQAAATLERLRA